MQETIVDKIFTSWLLQITLENDNPYLSSWVFNGCQTFWQRFSDLHWWIKN